MSYDPSAYGYTGSYNPWQAAQARQRTKRRSAYPGVAHPPTTYTLPSDLRGVTPTPSPDPYHPARAAHPNTPTPLSFADQGRARAQGEIDAQIAALPPGATITQPFERGVQDIAGYSQAALGLLQGVQHASVDTATGLVQQQQAGQGMYDQLAAQAGGSAPTITAAMSSIPTAAYGTNSANSIAAQLAAPIAAGQGYSQALRNQESQAIDAAITQPRAQIAAQLPTLANQYATDLQARADTLGEQAWQHKTTEQQRADTLAGQKADRAYQTGQAAESRREFDAQQAAATTKEAHDYGISQRGLQQQWNIATLGESTKVKLAYLDAQISQAKDAGDFAQARELQREREQFQAQENAKTRTATNQRAAASRTAADRRSQQAAQRATQTANQRLKGQGLTAWRQALNDAYGSVDDSAKGTTVVTTGPGQAGGNIRVDYNVLNPDTGKVAPKTFRGPAAAWDRLKTNPLIKKESILVTQQPGSSTSQRTTGGRSYYAAIKTGSARLKQIRDAYNLPYTDAEITQIVQQYANPKFKALGLLPGSSQKLRTGPPPGGRGKP